MAAVGPYSRSLIGWDIGLSILSASAGPATYAMAALNTGIAFRFQAPAFTPTAGWQLLTFASVPTTGLTAGVDYAVVLLTTVAGTTQTLRAYMASNSGSVYPSAVLIAADGTTRSNFTEQASSYAICTFIMDDAVEETLGLCQFSGVTSYDARTTNAFGAKFIVPTGMTWTVEGVVIPVVLRIGTPAGDLRCRIFDSGDSAVSGASSTADKDLLAGVNGRRAVFRFPAPVVLSAGTYRVVFDSASSANSSNCWRVNAAVARAAGVVPSGFIVTSTADITAGTISWSDTATNQPPIQLLIDDMAAVGGSGGGPFGGSCF